jgi:hypothetical protein
VKQSDRLALRLIPRRNHLRQPSFGLRFTAYGKRRYLNLGRPEDGWTLAMAQRELAVVLRDVDDPAAWTTAASRSRWWRFRRGWPRTRVRVAAAELKPERLGAAKGVGEGRCPAPVQIDDRGRCGPFSGL